MTTLDAAYRALDDVTLEFGRLTALQGEHDRNNGTGRHDYGKQADQAAAAARRARRKNKLTWRHVLAEHYWSAITQADNGQLRKALVSLAAHALLWIAALDRRPAQAALPDASAVAGTALPQPSGAPSPAPENPRPPETPPCP